MRVMKKKWTYVTLNEAKSMHYNLLEAAQHINSVYSIHLFLWIASTTMSLAYRIYVYMKMFRDEDNYPDFHLNPVLIAFINCSSILLITIPCHQMSRKVSILV